MMQNDKQSPLHEQEPENNNNNSGENSSEPSEHGERKTTTGGDEGTEGPGSSFANHQSALDTAYNEKIKSEDGTSTLDPEQANRSDRRTHKTDVAHKKTGSGKQINPGM